MVFTHFGEPHRGQIEPFLSAPRLKHRVWSGRPAAVIEPQIWPQTPSGAGAWQPISTPNRPNRIDSHRF